MNEEEKKAALEAASKLKVPLLEAVMDKTPASLRRLGAAAAAVALPFVNTIISSKLGVPPIGDSLLMSTQAILGAYITQSVVNEIHDRGTEAKTLVATAADAAAVLNKEAK